MEEKPKDKRIENYVNHRYNASTLLGASFLAMVVYCASSFIPDSWVGERYIGAKKDIRTLSGLSSAYCALNYFFEDRKRKKLEDELKKEGIDAERID